MGTDLDSVPLAQPGDTRHFFLWAGRHVLILLTTNNIAVLEYWLHKGIGKRGYGMETVKHLMNFGSDFNVIISEFSWCGRTTTMVPERLTDFQQDAVSAFLQGRGSCQGSSAGTGLAAWRKPGVDPSADLHKQHGHCSLWRKPPSREHLHCACARKPWKYSRSGRHCGTKLRGFHFLVLRCLVRLKLVLRLLIYVKQKARLWVCTLFTSFW